MSRRTAPGGVGGASCEAIVCSIAASLTVNLREGYRASAWPRPAPARHPGEEKGAQQMQLRNVVLVDGARTAFARGGRGMLVATRLDETGAHILRTLMERNPKVKPSMVEDIGLGNVLGVRELVGIGANFIGRLAGLPAEACSFDTNRQCGSSMETLHRIAQSIMVGATECGVALGVERMGRQLGGGGGGDGRNRVTEFNKRFLEQNDIQRNLAHDHDQYFSVKFPDYILDSPALMSMTQTAQNVAEVYHLTREEMDEFAEIGRAH